MLTLPFAVALSVGLLAAPPAAPGHPVNASGTSRDFDKPPGGAPAERALWQAAYDANIALVLEQHTAATLARQAQTNADRLGDPAERGRLGEERAEALAKPLHAKWAANVQLMASDWPVGKVRVCRYELLNFESPLMAAPGPARDRQLSDAQRDLTACVEKATSVLRALRQANDELRVASAEAERALGPPRAPAKASAAAQAAPPPAR